MGAHSLQDDRTLDVARVVGRGAMATSVTLALAGTGAGFASAMPGHAGEHGDGYGYGYEEYGSEHGYGEDASCGTGGDDLVGGLIGDLGLSGSSSSSASSGEQCAEDGHDGGTHDGSGATTPAATSTHGGHSSDAGARHAAAPASTNPDDVPPAPGETKVIDIPDDPDI